MQTGVGGQAAKDRFVLLQLYWKSKYNGQQLCGGLAIAAIAVASLANVSLV